MKVDFLLADEDGTWRVQRFVVPAAELRLCARSPAGDDDWSLQCWAREHLEGRAMYRRIVLFAVYAVIEEAEDAQ